MRRLALAVAGDGRVVELFMIEDFGHRRCESCGSPYRVRNPPAFEIYVDGEGVGVSREKAEHAREAATELVGEALVWRAP